MSVLRILRNSLAALLAFQLVLSGQGPHEVRVSLSQRSA